MGIDIISYRAAIGNFYVCYSHRRLSLPVFKVSMFFQIYCAFYTFCLLGLPSYLNQSAAGAGAMDIIRRKKVVESE